MAQLTNGKNFFNRAVGPPSCKIGNWVEEQAIWDESMRLIASGVRNDAKNTIMNPLVVSKDNYHPNSEEIGQFGDIAGDKIRQECAAMKTHKFKTKPEWVEDHLHSQKLQDTRVCVQREGHDILNRKMNTTEDEMVSTIQKDFGKKGAEFRFKEAGFKDEVEMYNTGKSTGFW
ncbi:hypothetical protein SS50377_23138 [Spironucleus salmonicida]|uniref:Uncharacterized protein n=1 Tax=Spironucleus salmonicida TaxID=348837 RepID=V6LDF0_9EUKA|nr:hypothetical protein SS50377_23138 [Spironucleus salmonicida]|eukprot:EST41686.1 hypothetical protein SS50377_18773 [Spironucleus salmonicida]